jgi:hypothetical protein
MTNRFMTNRFENDQDLVLHRYFYRQAAATAESTPLLLI